MWGRHPYRLACRDRDHRDREIGTGLSTRPVLLNILLNDMRHCHKYAYPIYLYGLGIKNVWRQNVSKIRYAAPDYRIENLNNGDSELTNTIFSVLYLH